MEKGNQVESGVQGTPVTGPDAAPAGGGGTSTDPGTGTGTQGTPPPQAGGGGGSQADQSGPDDRPWQRLDRTSNADGTTTTVEHDGEGALRYTTTDSKGNVISQQIEENPNTGGYQPPAEEPPSRTYQTDGGTPPPPGGPEPFSDIPPDPNLPEWKSWRDMPAQDVDLGEGRSLKLDGEGHLEYQEGGQTFRHEGSRWVDAQTGQPAPKSVAGRASGAQSQLESGLIPGTQR